MLYLRRYLCIHQFHFSLTLKLRVHVLNTHYRSQTLTNVLTTKIWLFSFQEISFSSIFIYSPSERGTQAGQMRTSILSVDSIRKRMCRFLKRIGVL